MGDTSQEYHAHPAVSRSDLWLFSRSRRVYRASKDRLMDVPKAMLPPAKFDAFEVGSAAHIALLEPERFERDVVVWDKRRTTSRGGGSSTDWERFRDAHAGKVIVTLKQWFLVQTVTAVVNHRMQPLMASRAAAREQPLYWTEEVEVDGEIVEVECKALRDYAIDLPERSSTVDIKTTSVLDLSRFRNAIRDYGYWLQDAHYTAGIMHTQDREPRECGFYFLPVSKPLCEQIAMAAMSGMGSPDPGAQARKLRQAIESVAPAACKLMEIEHGERAVARVNRDNLMREYARCVLTGDWSDPDEDRVEQVEWVTE